MNYAALCLLVAAAGSAQALQVLPAPCNSTFRDVVAGTEYTLVNSTDDELGPCVRTFHHADNTHALLECPRVSSGRSLLLSTAAIFGQKSELHGSDFQGKVVGDLASNPRKELNVTLTAPIPVPDLPEGISVDSLHLGKLFRHTEYNCTVKVVAADVTTAVKPVVPSCDEVNKTYVVNPGEAFSVSHAQLVKCPLLFSIPNAVRPTLSCENFVLAENSHLTLSTTGVVPRHGVSFVENHLTGKVFGFLPLPADHPERKWTLELEAKDEETRAKAVVDCILGADIFTIRN
jgi:hypothetical protein